MKLNRINGSLCFTKTLANGEVKRSYSKNALTSLFENIILANSIGTLFNTLSGSEAGLVQGYTPCRYLASSTSANAQSFDANSLPCIYLLNLTPEEQGLLNKNIVKNPVLKSDLTIDESKIVGWASFDYVGTDDKRGTLASQVDTLRLSPVVDGTKYGMTFKWGAGKMNGTFNTVVLGTNIFINKLNGCSLAKGVDSMNPAIGETAAGGDFLCPNVSTVGGVVMTGPNEILLGDGNSATTARRVLNLLTGECTELTSNDPRYNAYLFSEPHTYIGEGRVVVQSTNYTYVYNYNGTSTSANKTLSSQSCGYAIKDNLIYVKNRVVGTCIFNAYDMATLNAVSSSNITVTLNPDVFGDDYRLWYLTNFMDKFMLIKANNADNYPVLGDVNGCIFTDLTDPMNSVSGVYNGNIGSNVEIVDTEESIIDYRYITFRNYNVKPGDTGDYVYPPSGVATLVKRNGVKLVFNEGYTGQVFTYSILDEPITVNNTEGLLIDYMFHF